MRGYRGLESGVHGLGKRQCWEREAGAHLCHREQVPSCLNIGCEHDRGPKYPVEGADRFRAVPLHDLPQVFDGGFGWAAGDHMCHGGSKAVRNCEVQQVQETGDELLEKWEAGRAPEGSEERRAAVAVAAVQKRSERPPVAVVVGGTAGVWGHCPAPGVPFQKGCAKTGEHLALVVPSVREEVEDAPLVRCRRVV